MKDSISPRVREIPPHCATCSHYGPDQPGTGAGECRLYRPALVGTGDNLRIAYPRVAATDYCGAHPDAASLG